MVRSLPTVDTTFWHPAQGPALPPLQVTVAQPAQLRSAIFFNLCCCGSFLKTSHLAGECFLLHSWNITHSWVHFASGSQALGGGKRTFFRSVLRSSLVAMTRALRLPEFPRSYRLSRPSEDGDICALWRGLGLGSACRSLIATMLVAYSSRSSTNPHALLKPGWLPKLVWLG
jgi:hypothetical protein